MSIGNGIQLPQVGRQNCWNVHTRVGGRTEQVHGIPGRRRHQVNQVAIYKRLGDRRFNRRSHNRVGIGDRAKYDRTVDVIDTLSTSGRFFEFKGDWWINTIVDRESFTITNR